ncbi:putative thiamine biosynthetic bifunctional enzyme [Zalerion maritima]|uniref:Thiamine biosynthetic bifunctional enzyme n=1 Tax=Zalerion maritima TaxID=339359 RepID=A0AAD5WX22_9PEZI|nr:putative thiamine biosynthetic bifunctional enzyme [Zalerion maritima]
MDKTKVSYSLYLVTDSTPAILGDKDICHVVEEALKGGVTMVQYRDKQSDTGLLIKTAKKLHAITKKYYVPLLVNDRVDVALAVGCEGVHIGQDDMDLETARKLLGPNAIIGVTAGNVLEAASAVEGGADYLGIGTVYSTATKRDTKHMIGPAGVRNILEAVAVKMDKKPHVVCIGGIGAHNVQRVLLKASPPQWPLDGVAIVSAIMGSQDPQQAAKELATLVATPAFPLYALEVTDKSDFTKNLSRLRKRVAEKKPICHNMTNLVSNLCPLPPSFTVILTIRQVVQNFAANVTLSIGASPIMSSYSGEAADLAKLGGALVINAGTVTPAALENYEEAVHAYNAARRPVVLDPVGFASPPDINISYKYAKSLHSAGATAIRRSALRTLLSSGYYTVIKGNEAEILEVSKVHNMNSSSQPQQRGVDSSSGGLQPSELALLVKELAIKEGCVVVMTGVTDYVSDGKTTILIENGHEYLGRVTGTGCTLGTAIAAYIASSEEGESVLQSVVAAMLHFETAAEIAASQLQVYGPGTFVPAFLDALASIHTDGIQGLVKVKIWEEGS